jgi:hypothetical protein
LRTTATVHHPFKLGKPAPASRRRQARRLPSEPEPIKAILRRVLAKITPPPGAPFDAELSLAVDHLNTAIDAAGER